MDYRDFDFDAEGRDDVIRMEIEELARKFVKFELPWTQEASDMYAELDMKDCE